MRENHSRYSTVSIVLHWTIAILIIANATFGGWMEDASDSEKLGYYQLHKSVGITILALSLIRLGWRFGHPWPAFPGGMPSWERMSAHLTIFHPSLMKCAASLSTTFPSQNQSVGRIVGSFVALSECASVTGSASPATGKLPILPCSLARR